MKTLVLIAMLCCVSTSGISAPKMSRRIVKRCDGVIVQVWCDADGCSRDPEVINQKSKWWKENKNKVKIKQMQCGEKK